jgi:hypothetical protein
MIMMMLMLMLMLAPLLVLLLLLLPGFASEMPDTAEEYLRRVRYEAARCPRVRAAPTHISSTHQQQQQHTAAVCLSNSMQ